MIGSMAKQVQKKGKDRHPRGNRIVPCDVPATKCLNPDCGYIWPNGGKPRTVRTWCRKCGSTDPENFTETTLPGYTCLACGIPWYPRGRVRCRSCGAYLKPATS